MKLTALILILFCFFCTSLEAGEIYEWIDENGVKHFTNEPPPKGAKIVKEAEEIETNQASDQKPVQKGAGALKKDAQSQETSTRQTAPSGSSNSLESTDVDEVDPVVRRREAERLHDKRKDAKKLKHESVVGDNTDKGEEAGLGDPNEKKNIGDPEEKKDFRKKKF